uniref:hypothetical protein n=1 Tax=Salmonella enterica TaxID=28901 RepID=UPI0032B5F60D
MGYLHQVQRVGAAQNGRREVSQELRTQYGADAEFAVFQILRDQFFDNERDVLGVVQLVIDFGLDLLAQLGQALGMECPVFCRQRVEQLVGVLRQFKVPGAAGRRTGT